MKVHTMQCPVTTYNIISFYVMYHKKKQMNRIYSSLSHVVHDAPIFDIYIKLHVYDPHHFLVMYLMSSI